MKNILKLMFAVGAVAQAAFGAGTWTEFPDNTNNEIYKCDMDKDGNILYTLSTTAQQPTILGEGIFIKYNDDNPATNLLDYLPASMKGKRYGVYYDATRDSIYAGGVDGQVYRGRGTTFTTMPSVPLAYSRLDGGGVYMLPMTHVNGFVRDSKDRLLALTDSLVWYLDVNSQTWKLVGSPSDYLVPYLPFAEGMLLPNGDVLVAGNVSGYGTIELHIVKPDLSVQILKPLRVTSGMVRGPTGKVYGWHGTGQDYYYVNTNNGYTVDTVHLQYPVGVEGWSSKQTGSVFEDPSGLLWVGQTGRLNIVKKDSTLYSFTQHLSPATGFKIAPDSTFWVCALTGLNRYSEKYRLPAEATNSILKVRGVGAQVFYQTFPGGLRIRTDRAMHLKIASLQGQVAWQGRVDGELKITLPTGMWYVVGEQTKKAVLVK